MDKWKKLPCFKKSKVLSFGNFRINFCLTTFIIFPYKSHYQTTLICQTRVVAINFNIFRNVKSVSRHIFFLLHPLNTRSNCEKLKFFCYFFLDTASNVVFGMKILFFMKIKCDDLLNIFELRIHLESHVYWHPSFFWDVVNCFSVLFYHTTNSRRNDHKWW